MNDSRLNDLFKDFQNKYPKIDYFTQEEIFQYIRMGFHLGYDNGKKQNTKHANKKVICFIGDFEKPFESISEAARIMKNRHSNIQMAIKKGWKSAGYYWKHAK